MAEMAQETRCLTYVAKGEAEIRPMPKAVGNAAEGAATVQLRALWSGISRGTERLVFNGQVPESEHRRMRGPFQHGDFPFPVGYGYSWVGTSHDDDPQTFFGLFPHQEQVLAPQSAVVPLPAGLDPRRAVLAANMETALNVIWDGMVGPGDRVAIIGGGVLGLLVAGILADMPATTVTVVDLKSDRAEIVEKLGARFALPSAAPDEQDVVVHTSASEAGLATALNLAGSEGLIVEASWFGALSPRVPLGGAFHSKRLTLRSSQVGAVNPMRRPRFPLRRRLAAALHLLLNPKYEALITNEVAFADLPARISGILDAEADGLATAVSYV